MCCKTKPSSRAIKLLKSKREIISPDTSKLKNLKITSVHPLTSHMSVLVVSVLSVSKQTTKKVFPTVTRVVPGCVPFVRECVFALGVSGRIR